MTVQCDTLNPIMVLKAFFTTVGVMNDSEESHLIEVREGFQATYPMNLGIPLIPIDHITYKGGLEAVFCNAVSLPGSDHRGLVASFAFKE